MYFSDHRQIVERPSGILIEKLNRIVTPGADAVKTVCQNGGARLLLDDYVQ